MRTVARLLANPLERIKVVRTRGYEEPCEVLGFDPTKPTVGNVTLLSCQVDKPRVDHPTVGARAGGWSVC